MCLLLYIMVDLTLIGGIHTTMVAQEVLSWLEVGYGFEREGEEGKEDGTEVKEGGTYNDSKWSEG